MTTGDLLAMISEIAAGAEPLAERATRIDVESDRVAAFGDPERALIEGCATAIVPLYGG